MELIISVLSLFIRKGGAGEGGRISGDHSFFQEKRGGGLVSADRVSKGD